MIGPLLGMRLQFVRGGLVQLLMPLVAVRVTLGASVVEASVKLVGKPGPGIVAL